MNPLLLSIWAALTISFLALLVYRGQLTRYEEDQLFLNDSNTHERELQTNLVRRIEKLQPIVRVVGGAAGLATACAVGIYVWDAWKSIQ